MASQVILPKLTYEMQDGRIFEWLCAEGQSVSAGQPLFVIETDKATTEVAAEQAGVLLKVVVPAGVDIPVGTTVAWIGRAGEGLPAVESALQGAAVAAGPLPAGAASQSAPPGLSAAPVSGEESPAEISASPVARRMARELGIDLHEVARLTGLKRIREADIQAFLEAREKEPPPPAQALPPAAGINEPVWTGAPAAGSAPPQPEYEIIQPRPLHKAMASRMAQAALVPQMAAGCEVDLSRLEKFREELLVGWEKKYGFRLSYTHLLAVLAARAVVTQPFLNASWTEQGIRLYRRVDLGIAMATERGLLVPVVRGAGERSLGDLACEIVRLQAAAKSNHLRLEDLEGGTFTLTNVGMLGIEFSVPLLNPPQSAILGVGARRTKLALENGLVKQVPVMSVTLVSDHRIVDGAVQGAFLRTLREYMENPTLVLTA